MKGLKILIADDQPARIDAFTKALRGNKVHSSGTGAGLVSLLKVNAYDAVFVGLDGTGHAAALADWLKRKEYAARIVVHSLAQKDFDDVVALLPHAVRAPWCWGDAKVLEKALEAREVEV